MMRGATTWGRPYIRLANRDSGKGRIEKEYTYTGCLREESILKRVPGGSWRQLPYADERLD